MTNLWDGLLKGLDTLTSYSTPILTTIINNNYNYNNNNSDNKEVSGRRKSERNNITLPNSAIILLTDGIPNIEPPRGTIAMLQRYKGNVYIYIY